MPAVDDAGDDMLLFGDGVSVRCCDAGVGVVDVDDVCRGGAAMVPCGGGVTLMSDGTLSTCAGMTSTLCDWGMLHMCMET